MIELKIDPEFRDKIPPLTSEEFKQLCENILADGEVREPLVVWNGTIVDGHNRYKIVQEHPEIPYKVKEMEFADKWAAFEWIYKNQLGRRNLTDEQRTMLMGKTYEARKKSVGGTIGNKNAEKRCAQNEHPVSKEPARTSEILAKELGVGKETIKRAEKFAKGIDALQEIAPDAAEKVLQGKASVTKATVSSIPQMSPEAQTALVEHIRNPKLTEQEKRDRAKAKAEKPKSLIQQMLADLKADKPSREEDFTDDISESLQSSLRTVKNILVGHSTELTPERREKVIAALMQAETAIEEMKGLVQS